MKKQKTLEAQGFSLLPLQWCLYYRAGFQPSLFCFSLRTAVLATVSLQAGWPLPGSKTAARVATGPPLPWLKKSHLRAMTPPPCHDTWTTAMTMTGKNYKSSEELITRLQKIPAYSPKTNTLLVYWSILGPHSFNFVSIMFQLLVGWWFVSLSPTSPSLG